MVTLICVTQTSARLIKMLIPQNEEETFSLTMRLMCVCVQVAGSALECRGRPPRGRSHHLSGNRQALLLYYFHIAVVSATVS